MPLPVGLVYDLAEPVSLDSAATSWSSGTEAGGMTAFSPPSARPAPFFTPAAPRGTTSGGNGVPSGGPEHSLRAIPQTLTGNWCESLVYDSTFQSDRRGPA